jgi:hypothetical protein
MLEAERDAEATVIVFTLPVQALPRGDYQVRLSGLRDSGETEALETYTFRVTGS